MDTHRAGHSGKHGLHKSTSPSPSNSVHSNPERPRHPQSHFLQGLLLRDSPLSPTQAPPYRGNLATDIPISFSYSDTQLSLEAEAFIPIFGEMETEPQKVHCWWKQFFFFSHF